ncbi:MAG TPA: 2-phospho-L-lactate transferase CofD family protein, partial [Candidatus Methanoperedens sp.]|nr:2-phospho-L-lactate transferase CofD family protein [Candidatus Methanoperedens sp.]
MNTKTKICTIGGGTGMPVINEALVKAGFSGIKSIVTTFDNGGDTGRLITDERGQILANSDYWRSLISLWKDGEQKKIWVDMLRYRDGRARNFGNIFFQFMSEKSGSLADVDVLFK